MSAHPFVLDDFGPGADPAPAAEPADGARLEAERLAAFEAGHAAGLEAARAEAERTAAQGAEAALARLNELSFTYHEARGHVLRSVMPLIGAVADRIVPRTLRATLGVRLTEMVEAAAAEAGASEVEILVAPGEAEPLREALAGRVTFPLAVREEPGLAPGLHHVRLGERERELDLTGLERELSDALSALDTATQEMMTHG